MERRNFLKNSSLCGGAMLLPILQLPSKHLNSESQLPDNSDKLRKVKQAMLSMQRASWEQGVGAQAFLELGDYNMVCLMAREAALRQTEEGRLSVVYVDNGVTDPAASGEAVLFAAQYLEDASLKKAADKMLRYLLDIAPKTKSGILYHTLDKPEIWVDSLYMAPPFLAAAGNFKEAVKQINGVRSYLWNSTNKLFSHRWSDKIKDFVNKNFWGVGNGWAITGMCRVLKKLPSTMKTEKELLIHYIKEALDGCIGHIRPDYLFHNVIDDKTTFIETNLSQMVAYTIFRGVAGKWLDKSYLVYADNMRKAAHKKVHTFGYVQDVCGAPFFTSPGRATEGQAFFLLMEAAFKDLMES